MSRRIGTHQVKVIDLLGLLIRAPRTTPELCELTGIHREAVHWWLHLLVEEGLLRKEAHPRGHKGGRVFKYFWNHPCPNPQNPESNTNPEASTHQPTSSP